MASNLYNLIETTMRNTHADSHSTFSLQIKNIFEVYKASERLRYQPFEHTLHNKFLLWHGVRHTSVVSVLREGLKIAPVEAPSSVYMFGKGLYFTDCASKAANHCQTTVRSTEGFLILAEVALGNMHKAYKPQFFKRAP
jgi:hypothetical protein